MSKNILKSAIVILIILLISFSYIYVIGNELFGNFNDKNTPMSTDDITNDTSNDSIILTNIELHKNLTYVSPTMPSYILRLDDVQSPAWSNVSIQIINDTLSRNMSIAIGVIPNRDMHDANNITGFIKSNSNNSRLEIAQHGFNHVNYEYANIDINETQLITMKGLRKLYYNYGVCPTTFIPPNNRINNPDTLYDMGFRIVSGNDDTQCNNTISVGYTTTTKWSEKGVLEDPDIIIASCNESFKKQNLSVIMMHPQDFVGNDKRTLDPAKYQNYLELLDKLNETGAQSITFRDLLIEGDN